MSTHTITPPAAASASATERSWSWGAAPADFELVNVRLVTPDAVVPDGRIVVREGRIAELGSHDGGSARAMDGNGLLLLPGLIDVHSDALEKERLPRPSAPVAWDFAMASLEGKFAAAGVTTAFHGAAFQHQSYRGGPRDLAAVGEVCRVVDQAPRHRVDHQVLHRLDVLSQAGADLLHERLEGVGPGGRPALVSHEDHTPGQGQYADPQVMIDYIIAEGGTPEKARDDVDRLVSQAQEQAPVRAANLAWLGELARQGRILLAGHDVDTRESVDELAERGGTIAEFPTTREAAERARELGMTIVAGAPNLLRGGSHAGNISAGELVQAGLLDALASDYLPSALLGSVWQAAAQGLVDLPRAVSLVTSGPARVAGLSDRGSLTVGRRADLVLVDDRHGDWPRVVQTFRAGASA